MTQQVSMEEAFTRFIEDYEDDEGVLTYEQAISILMATMKAPVQKLASTLNEVPGKLVRTIAAIRDAKEAG